MQAQNTKLGVLLVFDGRKREHGKPFACTSEQALLVEQIFVDVRREVKSAAKKPIRSTTKRSDGRPSGMPR